MSSTTVADRFIEMFPVVEERAAIFAAFSDLPSEKGDRLLLADNDALKLLLAQLLTASAQESGQSSPLSSQMKQQLEVLHGVCMPYILRSKAATAATVLTTSLVATYQHGDHAALVEGSQMTYTSLAGPYIGQTIVATVKFVNVIEDYIIMTADLHKLEQPVLAQGVSMGFMYVLLGFSNRAGDSPLSTHPGSITGIDPDSSKRHLFGSGGSRTGDSGGPVFTSWDGGLFGMNVGNVRAEGEVLAHDPHAGGYVPSGCSPRNTIVSVDRMLATATHMGLV